ncbi:MAG: organomercurial lyase [bacterium]|nr:organomercurial lyase [bacterium]
MSGTAALDRTYCIIRDQLIETGQAPHYIELARALGVTPAEGREAMHELINGPFPSWFQPGSDYIGSFPPFSNIPTQFRITVDGRQKWFAQCAFESLAMCWMFPGKEVEVDTYCMHTGEPLRIVNRDGEILHASHPGIHGYVALPFRRWRENLPFA